MILNKSKLYKTRRITFIALIIIVISIVCVVISLNGKALATANNDYQNYAMYTSYETEESIQTTSVVTTEETVKIPTYPQEVADTITPQNINSEYAILVDAETGKVIASKNAFERIYPASLTKIMTLIVAVEHVKDFDKTFTMTDEIIYPLVRADASRAGFKENEDVKIIDLLYGAILPSGADATVGLAYYVSGSEEEFVKLMNLKASELGLKDTHFTNTSGLYSKEHYSTPADIATILNYAIKNDLCREVLSTYQYTTNPTDKNPDGIDLTSTMFSRMKGDEVSGISIMGGKTGYIDESRHCLASFAIKPDNKEYIEVTTMGTSRYSPIFDSFELYKIVL